MKRTAHWRLTCQIADWLGFYGWCAAACLQVGAGRVGVGYLKVLKAYEEAAKNTVPWVSVKGVAVKGNAQHNLWLEHTKKRLAGVVMAVPYGRVKLDEKK